MSEVTVKCLQVALNLLSGCNQVDVKFKVSKRHLPQLLLERVLALTGERLHSFHFIQNFQAFLQSFQYGNAHAAYIYRLHVLELVKAVFLHKFKHVDDWQLSQAV